MALTRPRFGQLNTGVVETSDPITVLNQGAANANVDVGFLFNRANGLVSNVALYWSESAQSIVTAFTSNSGSSSGNVVTTSYANLSVGNVLLVNGGILNVTGNINGNTVGTHFGNVVATSVQWANGTPLLSSVSSDIATANTALKAYVDTQDSAITTAWQANAAYQSGQIAGANAAIVTANTALKSYVDAQDSAITTAWQANAASVQSQLASVNTAIVTANTALKAYTDDQVSGINVSWQANAATQASQIAGANAAIVTANTALKSYVDAQDSAITTAWQANAATQAGQIASINTSIATANTSLKSYVDDQVTTVSTAWQSNAATQAGQIAGANAAIVTANTSLKSYVDDQVTTVSTAWQSNAATQASQIAGANAAIITANTSLKSYVDAQDSAITAAWQANAASVQGQLTGANAAIVTANTALKAYTDNQITTANSALKNYVDAANTIQSSQIATLQSQVYTNSNVDAHLSSTGAGNITINAGAFNLTPTGPGAANAGSSTSIPTIVTDAFGRIVSLTSNAVSTTINTTGTTGTGSVSGGGTLTFTSTNGVIVAASGSQIGISTPQAITTGSSPTFAGLTLNGNTVINSTSYLSGVTRVTDTTPTSGVGSGALVVSGGASVAGNMYVGGTLYVANLSSASTTTISVNTGMVYLESSYVYPYDFDIGMFGHFRGGPANAYAHTGVVRNHNDNKWGFFSNVKAEPSIAGYVNWADPGLIWDSVRAGELTLSNTTPSTSVTTGALVINGGAGISGNLNVNSAGYFGYNAASTSLVNPSIVGTSSSQAVSAGQFFVQSALINTTATGSADIIAYPNNTTDGLTGFMDLGFTGNLFSDPSYTITKANDGYLFASAKDGSGLGGNLVLATDKTGTYNDIVLAVGSFYSNAEVARFRGNATNNGYLRLAYTTAATSTTTGALRVAGGVGIAGSLYIANTGDVSANIGGYYSWANTTISGLQTQINTTNANIGSYYTWANANISSLQTDLQGQITGANIAWQANAATQQGQIATLQTQVYANANVAAYLPTYSGAVTSLSITSSTPSTSTSTGALIVSGGVGVTGNVFVGNVLTSGLYWAGNGAVMQTGGSGTGIKYTVSSTVPALPTVGDQWFSTTNDVLYEYQDVGTGKYWIDVSGSVVTSGNVSVPGTEILSPFLLMGA